jgi:hypothetical protein
VILFHRIDDPESAAVRRRIVELGVKAQVDFQNVDTEGAEPFALHGGRRVPALWDGQRLREGRAEVLAVLETLRR